ncbi:MAG: NAD(P)-dependent oxidoreductase [Candidatus Pacearchaeota archaeon]|nr:NAD(P)-dependent oxidoreductase [Candidatus Pacearchaeota archaeon]
MSFYIDKKILVAGGTGMIGKSLVDILLKEGAQIRIASLDDSSRANPEAEFVKADLRDYENCLKVCDGRDYVFNLLCVKGNPKVTKEKPASFFDSIILFDTNLLRAAKKVDVERYLYTSTLGVYSPAEIFMEDEVWKTMPSENDWFSGWAKRMGELQAEAYKIEFNWKTIDIARPANTYGPYDNFDSVNAMVVPSLIKRVVDGENPLMVWGDGSSIRDFVYTEDIAEGIAMILEKNPGIPVNLGSGRGYSIKELVNVILVNVKNPPEVIWDSSKPSGDKKRIMDVSRAKKMGWQPRVSLEEGIKKTIKWYDENKETAGDRYDVFKS